MGRKARIATTGFRHPTGTEESHQLAMDLVRQAAAAGCDLCLLPENLLRKDGGICVDRGRIEALETDLGDLAREHCMYVLGSLPHWVGDKRYNAAMLFDREGTLSAPYRKIHPTEGEILGGTMPGREPGVIDFDFGRMGVLICFDIGWPDEWRRLRELGAKGVIWPSAYDGGFPLQAYAYQHRYWVISCVRSSEAKFIDPSGHVVLKTSRWDRLAVLDVDLDRTLFHTDDNWLKIPAIHAKYGDRVSILAYSEENYFTLETADEDLSVSDVIAEFGLETYDAYHTRVTRIQEKYRG